MSQLWSDRPLGVKLSALVAAGTLSLGVFAVVAVTEILDTGGSKGVLLASTTATSKALEADMMHDAVRGDVLQALLDGRGTQYQSAAIDLVEHADTFRERLAEVAGAGLSADVDAAVQGVRPEVDAYLESATQVIATAGRDLPAARDAYAPFLDAFEALETELPGVGEAIAADAARAAQDDIAQRNSAVTLLVTVAVVGVLLLVLLGWVITRSVVGPLRRVAVVIAELADGDLRSSTGITSKDEVGRIASALESSMQNIRAIMASIGATTATLASATEELSATSKGMARLAVESSAQSEAVAGAAAQVSSNVQTVSAGSAEMGASIREIAQNASEVSRVAAQAVTAASTTTTTVAKLGDSSLKIASVVKVITSIAEQTNLLALNATIEAARAGDAGKGFAVVANEVKELAQETARATQDITAQVQTIQTDAEGAVQAINGISAIIELINDSQTGIAAAVEEQTATTTEMNRNVGEAAVSAGQIAASITSVVSAANSTTRAMTEAQAAMDEVARMAATLSTAVGSFRY